MSRKLLWIGDAVASTGFAKCTHRVLDVLRESWEVHVLGINYLGDPHPYPYSIYPAWTGNDGFGVGRTAQLVDGLRPDLVLVQNDPWNIGRYVQEIRRVSEYVPIVASMPVDGKNCGKAKELNGLSHAIFWTQFGREQAEEQGFEQPASVIPLGVDLELYKPGARDEARKKLALDGVPLDAFIVGNLNRNQPRKRLDLTVRYFAEWAKSYNRNDAYLFLYVAPTGEFGYDVQQLMKYYGFTGERKRLILMQPTIGQGEPEEFLPLVYGSLDLQISTTQGEGWGLTTMEGMACGVPQLIPDWAALGEWADGAALKVPCSSTSVTPNFGNAMGGIADERQFVLALERLRASSETRRLLSERGLELVSQPQFRWKNIGGRFADVFDALVPETVVEEIA